MSVKNIIKAITLSSINATGFNNTYQAINSTPLTNPCFLLRIINNTTKDLLISFDGTTDNDFVQTVTTLQLFGQNNSQPNNYVALIAAGTVVYVKGAAAGTGLVYLAAYYQPQGV